MAYSAPVPSAPPSPPVNYANTAGYANSAGSAGYATNAGNANYANTAGYANSSGLPAYSQWQNATRYWGETGYIYVYIDNYTTSCHNYVTLAYFTSYRGYYFTLGDAGCDESIYTLDSILSNN